MNAFAFPLKLAVLLTLALFTLTGCESTEDGGGASVSGSVYYGADFYDPWYYGAYWDDPDIIVTPPPGTSPPEKPEAPPPRPTHPIARPPTPRPMPMPSIPSMPRPSVRR